jgi:hypothetical protein
VTGNRSPSRSRAAWQPSALPSASPTSRVSASARRSIINIEKNQEEKRKRKIKKKEKENEPIFFPLLFLLVVVVVVVCVRARSKVGYQVRFDTCASAATRLKFLTDGCLLRECLEDPLLSKYSIVILDEAHVRSLETDILFGLVRRFTAADAPAGCPKLVVMSATLESGKFAEFFSCSVFEIPGRTFPVSVRHCDLVTETDQQSSSYVHHCVDVAMVLIL